MKLPIDDLEMHVDIRGEGPPLLLLHGFTGRGSDFANLFDLDALGHRVIVPDLRGHGATQGPPEARADFHRRCALDVLALLDALGVARCRAIGTSLGGNTLLHVATLAPERVEAMVLFGAPSYFPAQAHAIMRQATGPLAAQARAFAEGHTDMCFTPPLLATITARTLIVIGDRDELYPLEPFVEQYRAIPRASLWVVPDGGHGVIYGHARDEFARRALAFVQ